MRRLLVSVLLVSALALLGSSLAQARPLAVSESAFNGYDAWQP
jgi:hypothetical protein